MIRLFQIFLVSAFFLPITAMAFEPVPIDEFFQRYPDEKQNVEDFFENSETKIINNNIGESEISTHDHGDGHGHGHHGHNHSGHEDASHARNVSSTKYDVDIQDFENIEFLFLNRISNTTQIIKARVGENITFENFTVVPTSCRKRQLSNNSEFTPVAFFVYDNDKEEDVQTENKPTEPSGKGALIYGNHIYLEMPGMNGFEHPIYDIRPVACS
ncbi:MAG: DUF2155 domain-containing protein [Pseudomonadota bacterium]